MRSIRRSSITYLMLLLGLALGGVGLLVDQFAREAIHAREEAETKRITDAYRHRREVDTERIEQTYRDRRREAQAKFDADLLHEARRVLAKDLQRTLSAIIGPGPGRGGRDTRPFEPRPPESMIRASDREGQLFRLRERLLTLAPGPLPLPTTATLGVVTDWQFRPGPAWLTHDVPRTVGRILEGLRKAFEDEEHIRSFEPGRKSPDDESPGVAQFDLIFHSAYLPKRVVATIRPAWPGHELPPDLELEDRAADDEYRYDDVTGPNGALYRRVVIAAGSRTRMFPVWIPGPAGAPLGWPARPGQPGGPPPRPADLTMRAFVQHARPYSDLEPRLAESQRVRDERLARLDDESHIRDEELARVGAETHAELTRLRARLGLIGGVTFVALLAGGWVVVGRGMSPVGKLSDAVSRVSEKDFSLPHDGTDLPIELAPIHARLTQTLALLRRAFAREKQSVADISHELRTPIASLLATIDVSLRKPRSPDQYRATLEDCRAIARQLSQLVERIMTLATLDAGNARTAVTRTDAAELAGGCAAVIRPLAEANGLTFRLAADGPLDLDTDPDKLREVLVNLLHNAVEYNRPGGRVELTGARSNGHVVLEVRDTGIGMTPDVRERIFERFYRADSSRHATGVHAGLGLAIVKEYVERLGGTIAVESEPDVGSTFRVVLPAATDSPDDHSPESAESHAHAG